MTVSTTDSHVRGGQSRCAERLVCLGSDTCFTSQQKTRERPGLPHRSSLCGADTSERGALLHHQEGPQQADDWRISGQLAKPLQHGGSSVSTKLESLDMLCWHLSDEAAYPSYILQRDKSCSVFVSLFLNHLLKHCADFALNPLSASIIVPSSFFYIIINREGNIVIQLVIPRRDDL